MVGFGDIQHLHKETEDLIEVTLGHLWCSFCNDAVYSYLPSTISWTLTKELQNLTMSPQEINLPPRIYPENQKAEK